MTAERWDGADVRWTGPTRRRGEVQLQAGDRAVVVDAGRHHIGSFGGLWSGPGRTQPARAGRGVVIRVADGSELVVSPRHLELVAPDHPLRPEPDGRHADWWLDQLDDWEFGLRVACFVPRSLPAVCRLLHPWEDHVGQPVRWQDVVEVADVANRAELGRRVAGAIYGKEKPVETDPLSEPHEGQLDRHTALALVDTLADATTTPDDVFFAIWHGWGDIPPARFPGAAHLDTPSRGHFLLRGPLEGALASVSASFAGTRPVSGIWWPADRAWFVHSEIDFHWTFIAGPETLLHELERHRRLEVVTTTHDAPANQLDPEAPPLE